MNTWEQAWVHPNQLPASLETQQSFHPHWAYAHRLVPSVPMVRSAIWATKPWLEEDFGWYFGMIWIDVQSSMVVESIDIPFLSFFSVFLLMWTDLDVSKGLKIQCLGLGVSYDGSWVAWSNSPKPATRMLRFPNHKRTRRFGEICEEKTALSQQTGKKYGKITTSVSSDIFCLTAWGARTKSLFSDQPHGAKLVIKTLMSSKTTTLRSQTYGSFGLTPFKDSKSSIIITLMTWLHALSSMASWHLGKVAKTSWFSFIRPSISINCQCFQCLQLKAPFCHTHHWHLWRSVQHPAARGTGHEGKNASSELNICQLQCPSSATSFKWKIWAVHISSSFKLTLPNLQMLGITAPVTRWL